MRRVAPPMVNARTITEAAECVSEDCAADQLQIRGRAMHPCEKPGIVGVDVYHDSVLGKSRSVTG